MRMKIYDDQKEAYALLKRWYELSPKDESLLRDQKIDYVRILFEKKMPTHAWAEYRTGNDIFVKGLELERRTGELSDKIVD